jgi:hypothetical protein
MAHSSPALVYPSDTDQQFLTQSSRTFLCAPDRTPDQTRHPPQRFALKAAITAFIDQNNKNPKPFRWTKSADDILASIERFCVYNTPGSSSVSMLRTSG